MLYNKQTIMKRIIIFTGMLLLAVSLSAQSPRGQQGREQGRQQSETKADTVRARGQERGAQTREQARQRAEEAQEAREEARQQAEEAQQRGQERPGRGEEVRPGAADPQGHAYGRERGGLHGRDFGQARAAAARSKEEKQEVTIQVAREVDEGIRRTERRLEEAREVLEERVANREISREEYEARKRRVEEIEAEMRRVEEARRETEQVIREHLPTRAPEERQLP
jgi:colicin import membrane protein